MYENYIYKSESKAILDAVYAVHSTLGPGFLEAVYQEALSIEFSKRNIPFTQQKELAVYYGDTVLKKKYYADFVCYDSIILELKAADGITEEHKAQLLNYLRATYLRLGFLINFGEPRINIKRLIV